MSDQGKLKDPPDYGKGDRDQDVDVDVDDRKPSPILEDQGNSRVNHVSGEGSTHQVSGGSDEGNNVIMPSRAVHSETTHAHHHRASPNSVGGRSSPSSIEDHNRRTSSTSRDRGSQQQKRQRQQQQRKRKANDDGDDNDNDNDPMNDGDHGGVHHGQQYEISLSEIEHKREASRISSRRNQERQRKRIEYLLGEETRLQDVNHHLRVENEIMQNGIVAIRQVLRLRQQQQQQQPHLPSSTTVAAAAPSPTTSSVPGSIGAPSLQGQQPNSNIQNLSQMLFQSIQQIPSQATQNGVVRSLQNVAGIISGTLGANVTMPQQQFPNQPTSNHPPFRIPQMQLNTDFSGGLPTPGSSSTQQDLLSAVEQLQSLVSLLFLLNMALAQQSSAQNMALSVQQNPSQSTFVQSIQPTWQQQQPPPPQQQQQPPSQPSPYQQAGPTVAMQPQPSQQQLQFPPTMENIQQHQQAGPAQAGYFSNQSPYYRQQQQQQLQSQSGYVSSEQAPQQQQYQQQLQQQQYLLSLLNSGFVVNQQQQPVDAGGVRAAQGITQSNIPSHPHTQRQHQQEQEQLHNQPIHQSVQQPLTFLEGQGGNINPIQFGISKPQQQQQQQPQQQPPPPGQGGASDNSNRMSDDGNYNADRSDFF